MRIVRTLLLSALASAAVAAPAHAAPWTFGLWASPKQVLGGDERPEKDGDKTAERTAAKGADGLAAGSEDVATAEGTAGTGGDDADRGRGTTGDDSQSGDGKDGDDPERDKAKGDDSDGDKAKGDDSDGDKAKGDDSDRGNGKSDDSDRGNGKSDDSKRGNGKSDDAKRGNGSAGGDGSQRNAGDSGAPALGPPGRPVTGKRVGAAVKTGEVRVQLPGSDAFVALDAAATMPVGTLIDARAGAVVLRTALPGGRRDRGTFGGGMFVVRQNVGDGVTELRLRGGSYGRCKSRALASTASKRRKRAKRVIRRLWGRDHGGRFRTHGHNSVATVRGTRWLTVERCDGTLTRVARGAVEVHNRRNGRTVLLHAGDSYLAKRHPKR